MRLQVNKLTTLFVVLLAAGLLAGCGSGNEDSTDTAGGLKSDAAMVGFAGNFVSQGDAFIPDSPRGLSDEVDVVVRGAITGVESGRHFVDEVDDVGTVVLQVRVDEVLQGEPELDGNGSVYVEVFGVSDAEGLAAQLPPNNEVVMYLEPLDRSKSVVVGSRVQEPDAGPAPGTPLFAWYGPRGFFMAEPGVTGVFVPGDGFIYPDATLDDILPGRDMWPVKSRPSE